MTSWKKGWAALLALVLSIGIFATPAQAAQDWPSDISITQGTACVIDITTGTVLFDDGGTEMHYPASITKIMTVLLALEMCDLDEIVTFSEEAVYENESNGSSHIARDVGEELTMEQCLYAIMLASANEVAWAVGEHIAGDIDSFADLMNAKAEELGCVNTHFSNPNGLHDDDHWTCAYDMALIAAEAYRNEMFRVIAGTKYYEIPPTNKHDESTGFPTKHAMIGSWKTTDYLYEYCTGGKTGYTDEAQYTLVSYAEKNGLKLVCVIMNSAYGTYYTDTEALFEYYFDNYQYWNISENETMFDENPESFFDTNATLFSTESSKISVDENAYVILPVNVDFSATESYITYNEDPDSDVVATIHYTYADREVGSADLTLITDEDTEYALLDDVIGSGGSAQDAAGEGGADAETEEKQEVYINIYTVLEIIGIIVAVILLAVILRYLYTNFYIIRHKMTRNSSKAKKPATKKENCKMSFRKRKK